jgi:endonuclease/exonuclease/phosphatase family metal-dependent hydrolase
VKNLSPLNKLVFLLNNLFAILFLASFAIPYIPPQKFPLLSILSLAVPLMIFIHLGFLVYWVLMGFKRQLFLSLLCLLLALGFSYFPYKFKENRVISGNSSLVMSFNVRLFNRYDWIRDKDVPGQISRFIEEQDPDILSMQEYAPLPGVSDQFDYKYEHIEGDRSPYGMGIFTKYPIINRGSLDFDNSANNAIFVDILKNDDTLRVYNVHLESLGVKPDSLHISGISEKDSRKLIKRLTSAFIKQQAQVEKIIEHRGNCPYPVIMCGDFNNTFYSWAYRNLKDGLSDSFVFAGKGFGKTYSFNGYPLRIDFILADPMFRINEHRNYEIRLSDHEPVSTRLSQ